jgi:hypothetical protein
MRPPDVKIRRPDGSVINCEIVGLGDRDGVYVWQVANVVVNPDVDEIIMGDLPQGTAMRFQVPDEYQQ